METTFPRCFAVKAKDDSIVLNSSSGGFFSVIASWIIDQGGVVFGASFDRQFRVVHKEIKTLDELGQLRGSKYVQSVVNNAFSEAKRYLESDTLVLFSGTECQIAGLKKFLRKDYEKLVTIDVVCHGVPTEKLWLEYLKKHKSKRKSNIVSVNFREKSRGWLKYSVVLQFEDGSFYRKIAYEDPFMRMFLSNAFLRPACYECRFKRAEKHSDITIADFWGIQKVLPNFDDDKGTSLVLINSERGLGLLSRVKAGIHLSEVDRELAVDRNKSIVMPPHRPQNRDYAISNLGKISFDELYRQVCIPLWRDKYRRFKYTLKERLSR